MIDYQNIESTILRQFEERMRQTQQSPVWHAEGDVYTHTMMVVEALKSLPEYKQLSERQQHILTIAALLHDIGKIPTTTLIDGEWASPHHAPTGSRMAREVLWKEYFDDAQHKFNMCGNKELMQIREAICLLIRYHSFPPHAIDLEGCKLRLHRIASNGLLAPDFTIRMLCILCKADMLGRKCNDQQQMLDQIALCEELAKEEGCYDGCYPFKSDVVRRAYLSGQDVWKEQELYDEAWGEVVLMSGLPGTGKDTWIAFDRLSNRSNSSAAVPDIPMISLDNIRREQKISPKADQGFVANLAREQAKEYLRRHQPFVWNATNITTQMRESLINLFETYHASVRIVYLETDWKTQQERNHSREAIVPQEAIEGMLGKMTLPEAFEARKVEWICV